MYQNHELPKKDLSRLLVAPQIGGMLDRALVEQGDKLTPPELLPLWT